jgi:hypothetical protein
LALTGYSRPVEREPEQDTEQQRLILEESEVRLANRDAAPDSFVEHRTSDEATPPPE